MLIDRQKHKRTVSRQNDADAESSLLLNVEVSKKTTKFGMHSALIYFLRRNVNKFSFLADFKTCLFWFIRKLWQFSSTFEKNALIFSICTTGSYFGNCCFRLFTATRLRRRLGDRYMALLSIFAIL